MQQHNENVNEVLGEVQKDLVGQMEESRQLGTHPPDGFVAFCKTTVVVHQAPRLERKRLIQKWKDVESKRLPPESKQNLKDFNKAYTFMKDDKTGTQIHVIHEAAIIKPDADKYNELAKAAQSEQAKKNRELMKEAKDENTDS